MVQVREANFIPGANGGQITASLLVGDQEVATTLPVGDQDREFLPLLNQLMVKVQSVAFVPTPDGGEIRATMNVGERTFVSRLSVATQDDLKPVLDRLLDMIGRTVIGNLQTALAKENISEPSRAGREERSR